MARQVLLALRRSASTHRARRVRNIFESCRRRQRRHRLVRSALGSRASQRDETKSSMSTRQSRCRQNRLKRRIQKNRSRHHGQLVRQSRDRTAPPSPRTPRSRAPAEESRRARCTLYKNKNHTKTFVGVKLLIVLICSREWCRQARRREARRPCRPTGSNARPWRRLDCRFGCGRGSGRDRRCCCGRSCWGYRRRDRR